MKSLQRVANFEVEVLLIGYIDFIGLQLYHQKWAMAAPCIFLHGRKGLELVLVKNAVGNI